jgi:branched-chain amino acid transport system ATP-binding protein
MLQVNNVTVVFGGVTAVNDVCFDVKDGEIMGLIGPNGAGKTTLMRVITGTVTPVSGTVSLENIPLSGKPPHERIRSGIGLSQQIVHPFRSMTVLENVAFVAGYNKTKNPVASIFRYSREKEKLKAKKILQILGINNVADAKPGNLPLGYLKRLEVARALALKPKILLLDEPLAGLNQSEARELADKLLELNDSGQTILLIEHNLSEIIRICNRIVVIDNGSKIGLGNPHEVLDDPIVRNAYLGEGHHAEP